MRLLLHGGGQIARLGRLFTGLSRHGLLESLRLLESLGNRRPQRPRAQQRALRRSSVRCTLPLAYPSALESSSVSRISSKSTNPSAASRTRFWRALSAIAAIAASALAREFALAFAAVGEEASGDDEEAEEATELTETPEEGPTPGGCPQRHREEITMHRRRRSAPRMLLLLLLLLLWRLLPGW